MSLLDDPEFKYLLIDRKKLIAEQTQPFDGKKACWVPVDNDYLKGEIQSTKGDDVTVLTEKMSVSQPIRVLDF